MVTKGENFYIEIGVTKDELEEWEDDKTSTTFDIDLSAFSFWSRFSFDSPADIDNYSFHVFINGIEYNRTMTSGQIENRNKDRAVESNPVKTYENLWEVAVEETVPTLKFSNDFAQDILTALTRYTDTETPGTGIIFTLRFRVKASREQELDLPTDPALEKQLDLTTIVDKNVSEDILELIRGRNVIERLGADPNVDDMFEGRLWFNTTDMRLRVSVLEPVPKSDPPRNAWVVEDLFHGDAQILEEHFAPGAIPTSAYQDHSVTWPKLSRDVQERFSDIEQLDFSFPSPSDLDNLPGGLKGYQIESDTNYYRMISSNVIPTETLRTQVALPFSGLESGRILRIRNSVPPVNNSGTIYSQVMEIVVPSSDGLFSTKDPLFLQDYNNLFKVFSENTKKNFELNYNEVLYLQYTGENETYTEQPDSLTPKPSARTYPKWRVVSESSIIRNEGGGVSTFEELLDTPDTITANEFLRGNSSGSALEFARVEVNPVVQRTTPLVTIVGQDNSFQVSSDTNFCEVTQACNLILPYENIEIGHELLIKNTLSTGNATIYMRSANGSSITSQAYFHDKSSSTFVLGPKEEVRLIRGTGTQTHSSVVYPNWTMSNVIDTKDIAVGAVGNAEVANKSLTVEKLDATNQTVGHVPKVQSGGTVAWEADTGGITITGGTGITATESGGGGAVTVGITDGGVGATQLSSTVQGQLVPSGGTTGQILAKKSNTDHDDEWIDAPSGGAGTITGVTAGTGLSGGGDSGRITLNVASQGITDALLADNAVKTAKIENNAVTSDKIGANQVTLAKMATNSVDTDKILDSAVTSDKLGTNSVITSKYATSSITEEKLDADLRTRINRSTAGGTIQGRYVASTTLRITNTGAVSIANWTAQSGILPQNATQDASEVISNTRLFALTARRPDDQSRIGYLFKIIRNNPGITDQRLATSTSECIWIPGEDGKLAIGTRQVYSPSGGGIVEADAYINIDVRNTSQDNGLYSSIDVDSATISRDTTWLTATATLEVYSIEARGEQGPKGDDGQIDPLVISPTTDGIVLNRANWALWKNKFLIVRSSTPRTVKVIYYPPGSGTSNRNLAADGDFVKIFTDSNTTLEFDFYDGSAFRQLTTILPSARGTSPNKNYADIVGGEMTLVADSDVGLTRTGAGSTSDPYVYTWSTSAGDSNFLGFSVARNFTKTLEGSDYRDGSISHTKLASDVNASNLGLGKSYDGTGNIPADARDLQDLADSYNSFAATVTNNNTIIASSGEGNVLPPEGIGTQLRSITSGTTALTITQTVFNEKEMPISVTNTTDSTIASYDLTIGDVGKIGQRLYIKARCEVRGNSSTSRIRLRGAPGWTIKHTTPLIVGDVAGGTGESNYRVIAQADSGSSNNREELDPEEYTLTRTKNPSGTFGQSGYENGEWRLQMGTYNASELIGEELPPEVTKDISVTVFDAGSGSSTLFLTKSHFDNKFLPIRASASEGQNTTVNIAMSPQTLTSLNIGDSLVVACDLRVGSVLSSSVDRCSVTIRTLGAAPSTTNAKMNVVSFSGVYTPSTTARILKQINRVVVAGLQRSSYVGTIIKTSEDEATIYPGFVQGGVTYQKLALPPDIPTTQKNVTTAGSFELTKALFDAKYAAVEITSTDTGAASSSITVPGALFNSLEVEDRIYISCRAIAKSLGDTSQTLGRSAVITFDRPTPPTTTPPTPAPYILAKQTGGQISRFGINDTAQSVRVCSIERPGSFLSQDYNDGLITIIKTKTDELTVLSGRSDAFEGGRGSDVNPETGETIKTKLEALSGDDRLDASAVKDLPPDLSTIRVQIDDIIQNNPGEVKSGSRGIAVTSARWDEWKSRRVYFDAGSTQGPITLVLNGLPTYSPTAAHVGESANFIFSRHVTIDSIWAYSDSRAQDLSEIGNAFIRGSRNITVISDQREQRQVRLYANGLQDSPSASIGAKSIQGSQIADNTIPRRTLEDRIIDTNKLADNAVVTSTVSDGNITESKLSTAYRSKVNDFFGKFFDLDSTNTSNFNLKSPATTSYTVSGGTETERAPFSSAGSAYLHDTNLLGSDPHYNISVRIHGSPSVNPRIFLPRPSYLENQLNYRPMTLTILNTASRGITVFPLGQIVPLTRTWQVDSANNVLERAANVAFEIAYTLNQSDTARAADVLPLNRANAGGGITLGAGAWLQVFFTGHIHRDIRCTLRGRDSSNNNNLDAIAVAQIPIWVVLQNKTGTLT